MTRDRDVPARPVPLALPDAARVLALAPHADDDVLGAGGALALHARAGARVHVLVAFDGRLGLDPGVDPAVRREEALAAGRALGFADYEFWDYPEGHEPGAAELEAACARLATRIDELAPDVLYAPWSGDAHRDHRVLACAADAALARVRSRVRAFGYEVWSACPADVVLDIGAVFDAKIAALRCHRSQLARTDLVALATANARRAGRWLGPGALGECFVELGSVR